MRQIAPCTGTPEGSRVRWWTELPLIAVVYAAYSAGRLLARGDVASAVGHGVSILHVEQHLDLDFEPALNRLFSDNAILGVPADFAYASLHYLITPAVLVWLWRRHRTEYRTLRTWLLVSTLIGLIGFTLDPTCPPRLLGASHGFIDTMARYGSYGWWGGDASAPRGLGGLTNQYAAMPSLHVGWALWCGVVLWRHGRTVWARALAVAYPVGIAVVVMGTANHYFLDAVAGVAVMGVGYLLAPPLLRLADAGRARFGEPARVTWSAGRSRTVVGDPTDAEAEAEAETGAETGAAGQAAGEQAAAPGGPGATGQPVPMPAQRIPDEPGAGRAGTPQASTVDARQDGSDRPHDAHDPAAQKDPDGQKDPAARKGAAEPAYAESTEDTENTEGAADTESAADTAAEGPAGADAAADADRGTQQSGAQQSGAQQSGAQQSGGAPADVSDECETAPRERERIPRQQGTDHHRPADGRSADDGDRGVRSAAAPAGADEGAAAAAR